MPAARVVFDQPDSAHHVPLHPFTGFGGQLNTNIFRPTSMFANPQLAAQDHPKAPDQEGQPHDLTPAQRETLRDAIVNLKLGHSRVFVGRVLVATPEPPPHELEAFLNTLRLAQAAGATVNLTFWGQGPYAGKTKLRQLNWPEPKLARWPTQKEQAGKLKWPAALLDGGELTGPAELMRRFANIIARTKHEGLTCVRWVTIQNEPNQAPTDLAQKRNPLLSMRLYERLYRLLDEELSKRGIRDTVELVAGDLVLNRQNDWLDYIHSFMDVPRPRFHPVVDAYSIHVYWAAGDGPAGFPQQLESRLKGLAAEIKSRGITKPVYVTEFGVRTVNSRPAPGGPGSGQKIEFSPDVAFQHAWFMALAPHYGCAGLVKWALYRTDRRSAWGEWGMIDAPNPPTGRTSFGRSPTYRVTRLFNHLVDPDWTPSGFGKSADGTALASRFRGPAHESIAVLNRRFEPQQVSIQGLAPRGYFTAEWNHDQMGGPAQEQTTPVTPTGGALPLTVPARGIIALSTRPLQLT